MTGPRDDQRCSKRRASAGFTLVELMAVIIIIAILAALATFSIRKYINASKTSEATEMLGAIKTAQEQYKAETFTYKDVSGSNNLDDYSSYWPQNTPLKRAKKPWGSGNDGFRELGVVTTGPVLYIYGCAAGPGSMVPASPGITIGNYPTAAPGSPWYLVKAVGDLDGDGTVGSWVGINTTSQIFHDKQEE